MGHILLHVWGCVILIKQNSTLLISVTDRPNTSNVNLKMSKLNRFVIVSNDFNIREIFKNFATPFIESHGHISFIMVGSLGMDMAITTSVDDHLESAFIPSRDQSWVIEIIFRLLLLILFCGSIFLFDFFFLGLIFLGIISFLLFFGFFFSGFLFFRRNFFSYQNSKVYKIVCFSSTIESKNFTAGIFVPNSNTSLFSAKSRVKKFNFLATFSLQTK
mmetsp:Transcript_11486/g.9908  ORF Transcript_11486/g.9908 Transcript_11486/m.9908 type:complete len:217 (+) Transcript_11486:1577-2227(+)